MGELYHYGIKGMKWGVRKEPDTVANRQKNLSESTKDKLARKRSNPVTEQGRVGQTNWSTTGVIRDNNGNIIGITRTGKQYNYTTGKFETKTRMETVFGGANVTDEQFMKAAATEYDRLQSGEKPRIYIDKNGNIWQWNEYEGDYRKVGGTKGKMKETFGYKISQIGKKLGDVVNKTVESGKSFLSNLFKKK